MIVCIEGIDASGKATQAKRLARRLASTPGRKAELFSFPDYGTPAGRAILGHLKRHWKAMADASTDGPVDEIATDAMVLQSLMTTNRLERGADLRRAWATHLYASGELPLKDVSALLGHASVETTERYLRVSGKVKINRRKLPW